VKLTAKEQLAEAQRLGHELSFTRRDFGDKMPPKIRLECTCGYQSTWRRSEKAAIGTLVWHLGKVLGEADTREAEMRQNGITLRKNPAV
jgi:hypothetical protein